MTGHDAFEQVRLVLEEGERAVASAADAAALAAVKSALLGKSGRISALMEHLRALPKEEKPRFGAEVNVAKKRIEDAVLEREAVLGRAATGGPREDLTLPGIAPATGSLHPITRTIREVVRVFGTLGFEETDGPEIEDEFHNFVALNIPEHHPARDEADNFYVSNRRLLLRSQTSTIQVRTMETRRPPLRIVAAGRVYRPDTVDATHHYMFHQIEGLAIDEGLSMADLKTTLLAFVRTLYGEDVNVRLRPSFFPFTEPSAEIDVEFPGRGYVEIGGCGMVDPAVLEACGVDAARWSGFAFGLGIERLAMRRFAVPDIRRLTENDVRFLRQVH
jgi:phenylalanyl-tRNA synthetase alpha chain